MVLKFEEKKQQQGVGLNSITHFKTIPLNTAKIKALTKISCGGEQRVCFKCSVFFLFSCVTW